jgi:hypothetical protein
MRTASIEIGGKAHLLCFSARVVRAVTERYGGVENIDTALSAGDPLKALDESVWLLATMMDGGARYAKQNEITTAPALTADELLDVLDIGDFAKMRAKIAETITKGKETHVEADPGKNAETTPAAP